MANPLDDLSFAEGPASDVTRSFIENPAMPGEMPGERDARIATEQEVQRRAQEGIRRIKARDLARNRIPFATNPVTGDPEAIKDASGQPLQRFNAAQQVAYDSTGKAQRINWDESGQPTLSDPFAGIPVVTNPKTGQRTQKAPGLPTQVLGTDPEVEARNLEAQKEKAVAQAATLLGRKLNLEERQIHRDEVDLKARVKKLEKQYGINPDDLDSAPAAIEAAHQASLQDPRANDTSGWFGGELTPESAKFRASLQQQRDLALDEVNQIRSIRERAAAGRASILPQQQQLESIQGGLADRQLDRLRAQGVAVPEISQPTQPTAIQGNDMPMDAGSTPAAAPKPTATPDGTPIAQIPGTDKLPDVGFLDVFAHNPASRYVPFANGAADIVDIAKIGTTFLKLKNNPEDVYWQSAEGQAELQGAKEYLDWQKRERTFGGTVAEILSELPSFVGELAATWGLYNAGSAVGRKGAKVLIEKLLGEGAEKMIESKLGTLAIKGAGAAVGAAAQLPGASALRIAAETMERQLPGVQIEAGDDNLLSGIVTSEGDGFGEALRKSIGNQYVELLSERTGGALGFLPGADKLAQLKAGLASKWLGNRAGRTVKGLAETLNKVGWNGVLGEMFEERVGGTLQGAGGAAEILADGGSAEQARAEFIKEAIPTGKQLLAEGVAFGIPGAGIAAYNALRGNKPGEGPGNGPQPPADGSSPAPGEPPAAAPTSPPPSIIPPEARAPKIQSETPTNSPASESAKEESTGEVPIDTESVEETPLDETPVVESETGDDLAQPETIDDDAHGAATSPENELPEPTEAQKKAGNYAKGHVKIAGMDVSIENPAGSTRSGVDPDGKPWSVEMKSHYGYIRGSKGKDGDHIDLFVAPHAPRDYQGPVYVVNQNNRDGGFDEHKAILAGNISPEEAQAVYEANYSPGTARAASIARFDGVGSFRNWATGASRRTAPAKGDGPLFVPQSVTKSVNPPQSNDSAPVEGGAPISPQTLEGAAQAPSGDVPTPPSSGEPAAPGGDIRRGKVGDMLADGESVLTASGRKTTPFPKLGFGSDRKTQNTVRRVDAWLHENAVAEAEARGDDYNATIFKGENPAKLPPASKDAMEEYLFGEQPAVVKKSLKPLVSNENPGTLQTPGSTPEAGSEEGSGTQAEDSQTQQAGAGGNQPRPKQSAARRQLIQSLAQEIGAKETKEDLGSGIAINRNTREIEFNPDQIEENAKWISSKGGSGDQWVRMIFDEEATHRRDLLASIANGESVDSVHMKIWHSVPESIKKEMRQVYPDAHSDFVLAYELVRILDQIGRTGHFTEEFIPGRDTARFAAAVKHWAMPNDWVEHISRVRKWGDPSQTKPESTAQPPTPAPKPPESKQPDAARPPPVEKPALTQDKPEREKKPNAPRKVSQKKAESTLTEEEQQALRDQFDGLLGASSPTSYPRWKSLYIDRSGNPKGTMRDQGHGEIARDIAPDRLRTMLRARTQGSTIYLEATSSAITPSQRKFATEFAEQHGLTVQTNDRRPFMLGASNPARLTKAEKLSRLYESLRALEKERKAETDPKKREQILNLMRSTQSDIKRVQKDERLGASDPSRKGRIAELEQATKDLREGKITREQRDEVVRRVKAFSPLTSVPAIPSDETIRGAITSAQRETLGANRDLPEGKKVGVRMDIPAFTRHGVRVITIHEPAKGASAGKVIGYDGIARIKNPVFNVGSEKLAMQIAAGDKAKAPGFTVEGEWMPSRDVPEDLMDWTQVGYDPERHSYFWDRETGRPVTGGDEAVAIGSTVFVKNAKFSEPSKFLFASDPEAFTTPFPADRIVGLMGLAMKLAPKIQSPEDLAKELDAVLGDKARKFSQSFWFAFRAVGVHGDSEPNWGEIYSKLDAPEESSEEPTEEQAEKPAFLRLAEDVRDALNGGDAIDRRKLAEMAKDSGLSVKEIDEAAELGIVMAARDLVEFRRSEGVPDDAIFDQLKDLYDRQPNLTAKTSDSKIRQAYSTPIPLAFLGAHFTGNKGKAMDSTAGNSAMLLDVAPEDGVVNELDPGRVANLRALGFDAAEGDVFQFLANYEGQVDSVRINPPFGTVLGENGESIQFPLLEGSTREIDHSIVMETLKKLKDKGRAVLIIGGSQATSKPERRKHYGTGDRAAFFKSLYEQYGVLDHFTVNGDLYSKQGAGWPVDVIMIDGRRPSPIMLPTQQPPRILNTWEDVKNEFTRTDAERIKSGQYDEKADRDEIKGSLGGIRDALAGGKRPGQSGDSRPDSGEQSGATGEKPVGASGDAAGDLSIEGIQPDSGAGDSTGVGNDAGDLSRDAATGRVTKFHKPYVPVSKGPSFGIDTPINMADPQRAALERIERAVGMPLDQYVRGKLGYAESDDIGRFFAAEQVDALAAAIYNVEHGGALILGDQTGIGKGRVAAGMVEYAKQRGLIPVFVSKDPKLYSQLLIDAHNIGRSINPVFTNNDLGFNHPITGDKIRQGKNEVVLAHIKNTGTLPAGRDVLFTTYSQINADKDPNESNEARKAKTKRGETPNDGPRMDAIKRIAPNALFILDESHLAAGSSIQGRRSIDMIQPAQVYYSSATFAKRAAAMPLYYKTNMRLAAADMNSLIGVFEEGGVVMQQIANAMLAQDGQYIRRERTYDGVPFETKINEETKDRDRALADEYTTGLRTLLNVSNRINKATDSLNDIMARIGKRVRAAAVKLETAEFASQIHNFVSQYLLAIKAESAAQQAIKAIKEGHETQDGTKKKHKVILALQNTNEGPITELKKRGFELSYKGILLKTLDNLRTITSGKGKNTTVIYISNTPDPEFSKMSDRELENNLLIIEESVNELGEPIRIGRPNEKAATELFRRLANTVFTDAEETIENLDLGDMPISPIDYIRQRLENAGIKTGELTGREVGIDENGETYSRTGEEISQKGQLATLSEFNNGNIDAMIINGSASTGISAHASVEFKRQDPRMMIVIQPHLDINEFVQTLGRIFRSGQLELPRYMILQSALPAEARPAAMLALRMSELSANTTSNTDSQVQEGAKMPNMFNQYGDETMYQYLLQHPDFVEALQWPKITNDKGNLRSLSEIMESFEHEEGKLIRGATSYAAVLPWELQEMMWQKLTSDYNALINYLDSVGENELRATVEDLGAETISREVFTNGTPGATSAFAAPSYMETVRVKSKKKPLEALDVLKMADAAAKTRFTTLEDFKAKVKQEMAKQLEVRRAKAISDPEKAVESLRRQLNERYNDIFNAIDKLGRTVSVGMKDGEKIGAVVGIEFNEEKLLTPSEHVLTVALNTIRQQIQIPASQAGDRIKTIDRDGFIEQYNETREDRVPRTIVTGNLIAGSARLGAQGKVVTFSRADGSTATGIMLPLNYSNGGSAEIETVEDVEEARSTVVSGARLTSDDGAVTIRTDKNGNILFVTASSKARGGKYWQDPILNAAMENGEMEQRGLEMIGKVYSFGAMFDRLKTMGVKLGRDRRLGASDPTARSKERVEAMKPGPKGGQGQITPGDSTKDAVKSAANVFKRIGNHVWNYLTKPPHITPYKVAKGEWLGTGDKESPGHQAADAAARELRKAINQKFSRAAQEAINVYREAGGDKATLQAQLDELKAKGKKRYLPIWEKALNLTAEEKAMADEAGEFYAEYAELGAKTGMLSQLREDYVNHFWDLSKLSGAKVEAAKAWGNMVMSRLKTTFDNAKARRFGSTFEGILEGYDPHTLAIGDLMSIYGQTFQHTLADRAFVRRLIRDVRGADGRPAVAPTGYAKKIGPADGANSQGVHVFPHFRPSVKVRDEDGDLTGEESDIKDYEAINHPALRKNKWVGTDTDGKPVILQGDLLVHPDFAKDLRNSLGRSALQNTPVIKQLRTANNFVKRTILSLSTFHAVTEGLHAIAHGVDPRLSKLPHLNFEEPEVKELVNAGLMLAGNFNAKQAFMEGLSGGGLFERIPWIGPKLQWWNEWLFEDYIPRLKQQMAIKAFRRNLKRFPELTRRQVAEITARQSNDAFGEQNYRYKGENPTAQDVARMSTFAWDFLRSRAQFFGDALKPRYGKEQRKALLLMAIGMALLCKVIERMLTGENHWDKPFYVVDGNRMYGFRTVPGDVLDAVADPRRFVNGRLSPLIARPAIEALTGRDYRGVKQTPGEQLASMIKGMAPIPMKSMVDDRADVGTVGNILNATGIHTKRYSDLTETRKRAREWQIAQGKLNADESYPPSKYLPLKQSLEDGDMQKAAEAIRELVQQQGKKTTREGVEQSLMRPFSGATATERAFEASLDGEARAQYKRADAKRRQMLQAFNALLAGVPDKAPTFTFQGF